jgi:mRNA-degrading endonuclease RelE of RelBE toxin-antitoxin system
VTYDVDLSRQAKRFLQRNPPKIADPISIFIFGPLVENPQRVGKPLGRGLVGLHSARVGNYRILYRIGEEIEIVWVEAIAHRADAYRGG